MWGTLLYFLRSEEGEKALKSVSIAVWLANLKKKDTQAPSYNKTGMITVPTSQGLRKRRQAIGRCQEWFGISVVILCS